VERRRGRRDNGLDAADFAAVGDLDPRLAEHLLDLLGAQGIAAYLQPSMDVNPITRNSTVPARPTDRLYADRAHLSTARDHLRRLVAEEDSAEEHDQPPGASGPAVTGGTAGAGGASGEVSGAEGSNPPGVDEPDRTPGRRQPVDATFEGIVAGFDRPVDPTAASWPAAENLSGAARDPAPGAAPTQRPPAPHDPLPEDEPSLLDGLDTFGADLPDTERSDERFVPPPPPPLPRLSRQTVLGGLAILVGLVLVLAPELSPFDRGNAVLLGFAAMLGGATALILRLRPGTGPGEDQHPDDGARV
jgi:hypothetical protein